MNRLDKLFSESRDSSSFVDGYFTYLTEILAKLDRQAISKFITWIDESRHKGRSIYFIGNGGSAATASHFANDLAIGLREDKFPVKALSLADNIAVSTAIANDWSYEEVFSRQLKIYANQGDLVVAISASGNSPNILRAISAAKEIGCKTVGLTGFDGGKLREVVDLAIHVPTNKGEYGPVEDIHMVLDHLIGAYLYRHIRR